MSKDFLKTNWVYITLLCLIVLVNILPRLADRKEFSGETKPERTVESEEKPRGTFMDFKEAKRRSEKIEDMIKVDLPLYLFYVSLNLSIVFLFLLGLAVDGCFIFKKLKKQKIFQKNTDLAPPPWKISEIFKIIILAFAFSYLFFIALSFFLGLIESLTGMKFRFYASENFRMIFDTIILDFFILLAVLIFLFKVHRRRLESLGFSAKNSARNVLYGVLGYVGIIPVILLIGVFIYTLLNIFRLEVPPQPIVGLFLAEENVALLFVSSIIASLVGPVIEEIFFRGVMYNAVKRKLGVFRAVLITSVLFSFLHTHAATYFLVGFVPITILGITLAYLYEKTGSLIPSITLHVLNNLGSVIMVFAFKYFNNLVS
jgi:membrane protease YdiL (CAAX protease family)